MVSKSNLLSVGKSNNLTGFLLVILSLVLALAFSLPAKVSAVAASGGGCSAYVKATGVSGVYVQACIYQDSSKVIRSYTRIKYDTQTRKVYHSDVYMGLLGEDTNLGNKRHITTYDTNAKRTTTTSITYAGASRSNPIVGKKYGLTSNFCVMKYSTSTSSCIQIFSPLQTAGN